MAIKYAVYVVKKGKKYLARRDLTKKEVKNIIKNTNNILKSCLLDGNKKELDIIRGNEYIIITLNDKTGEEKEVGRYVVDISQFRKRLKKC